MSSTPYQTVDALGTPGYSVIEVPQALAGMAAAADVLTNYVVPYAFQIVSLDFLLTTVVSTGSKAATVTLYTGLTGAATAVAGCALALTSANQNAAGALTLAPATATAGISATTWPAGTNLCLKSSAVTAFVEGAGVFLIRLRNMSAT